MNIDRMIPIGLDSEDDRCSIKLTLSDKQLESLLGNIVFCRISKL